MKLPRHWRTARLLRHPKLAMVPSGPGRLRDTAAIADRPDKVEERKIPGHCAGDLVVGTYGTSAHRHHGARRARGAQW